MKIRQILKTFTITAVMTLAATASHAQDLLARQAPIDRKARALDTLYLQRIIEEEMEESIEKALAK